MGQTGGAGTGTDASGTRGPAATGGERTSPTQSGDSNQLHPSLRQRPSAAPQQPQFLGSGGKAQDGSMPGGALVALTEEERKKIREIVLAENVAREPRANFKVQVGAKVPESVPLKPLPADAVKLVPRFKDFGFVIAGDRIVIVQQSTREIDSLIPL